MSKTATLNSVSASGIQWKQVWSLTALYASVVIGWIAYHNYQPKLLVKFSFTDFAFFMVLAKAIILIVTPPVAGKLGDYFRFKSGHRLPIISAGISFAAMIFMAVAFTLLSNPGEVLKWILPVLIILWLIAMSIFTSPALSTLELFTPLGNLPAAMAILTITGNLLYAIEPIIVDVIDYLGAPLTFVAGGLVVFTSGYALKKNSLELFSQQQHKAVEPVAREEKKSRFGIIFLSGMVMGLASGMILEVFPTWLQPALQDIASVDGKWWIAAMLAVSAVFSWPISEAVSTYGLEKSLWLSALVAFVSALGIAFGGVPFATLFFATLFALAFTALSVSALPLAIRNAGFQEKVFCVGVFFSGAAIPEGIIEMMMAY